MPSKAYAEFESEFLNANSWAQRKDGPPLELLDALSGQEREVAEQTLIQRLSVGDDWPSSGLGHIRSRNALAPLRALLPKTKGSVRATTALAIWQIARDPSMCDELIRLSRTCNPWFSTSLKVFAMIDIIHCLARMPYSSAIARLEELKRSRIYLISYNAGYALGLRRTAYSADANSLSVE